MLTAVAGCCGCLVPAALMISFGLIPQHGSPAALIPYALGICSGYVVNNSISTDERKEIEKKLCFDS